MFFRRILTYRLALYYLSAIMLAALALSAAGVVHQSVLNLAFSTVRCAVGVPGRQLGVRAGLWRGEQLGIGLRSAP